MYFRSQGFRVEVATDGGAGFVLAVETRPDVVVTDLSMPHVDGWEMTRRLRRDPRTAHILVIACTGREFGGAAERALDAGCDAYVVKPCLPEDLLRETRHALARLSARRRSA
jgi:two-component system cell cycle response regulator DivK